MVNRRRQAIPTATFGVSPSERDQAWALAALWSPRPTIRVANDLVDGELLNTYTRTARLDGPAPAGTWAMYLTDEHGYYSWLPFDLDAKDGKPAADAKKLTGWLKLLGIPYLVCRSGPTGGRHVWVRANRIHGATIAGIAHRAKSLLPSLDISPLLNVTHGAVRPPLAPHRTSGISWPIGDPYVLDAHEGINEDDAEALLKLLDSLGAVMPVPETAGIRGMVADSQGNPKMRGNPRRPSPKVLALLRNGDPSEKDKSRIQGAVLAGLAQARWSFDDVLQHLADSPALEHARTIDVRGRRVDRGPHKAKRALRNGWKLAVRFVASNPLSVDGLDDDFTTRETAVANAVHAAQQRADALPGRWGAGTHVPASRATRGRPSHRAVLDAVCLVMLQAVTLDVGVDTRRLAIETGYSKEATRQALLALCDDELGAPWLVKTSDAEGTNSATFKLHERFSTETSDSNLALALTPPATPPRELLLRHLADRLNLLAHDVFSAPKSLGRTAGRLLQQMPSGTVLPTETLLHLHHMPARSLRRSLQRLHSSGLIERHAAGWSRGPDRRDAAAASLGVAGYLEDRAARYDFDRYLWRWWCTDIAIAKRKRSGAGRTDPTKVPLYTDGTDTFPRYPRRPDRRRDCLRARRLAHLRLHATATAPEVDKPLPGRKVPANQRGVRFVA